MRMRTATCLALLILGAAAAPGPVDARDDDPPLVGEAFGPFADDVRWLGADGAPSFGDHDLTLIRWWTNGCPHCAASVPALSELRRRYGARGFELIAMYHPKGRRLGDRDVLRTLERMRFSGLAGVDPRWTQLKRIMQRGELRTATSISVLVDRSGTVRWVHPGPRIHPSDEEAHAAAARAYADLDRLLDAELPAAPEPDEPPKEAPPGG